MAMLQLAVLLLACAFSGAHAEIKLQFVDRRINLNSQFARVTESIKVKNTGSKSVDRVVLCQLKQQGKGVIAHQKVSQLLPAKSKLQLTPTSPPGAPKEAVCWEVVLKEATAAGGVAELESLTVYADVQVAYPAEISQNEQQLMLYHDNLYVVSPYSISTQNTEVTCPNTRIMSYTDTVKPVSKSDNKVTFGKYDLAKPWSLEPMKLHFENPKPFKKVLSLAREIEVSHWGNIYVEEQYELKNDGARHKGQFSRLRYVHTHDGRGNSFQDIKARLPGSAHSLYYVDIIGNISTSVVRKTKTETVLDFMTRYPLMGGWKTDFKIGYSVPLTNFLSLLKNGKRRLSIDFSTPLEGVYVEELIVKVVLPEGSSGISASVPHTVEQWRDVKYTYLDVAGRPVVVIKKQHVVPEHSTKVTVDYDFPVIGTLREPLMLIAAFAALFVATIAYNRLDLTIARDDKWQAGQDADKVATVMQALNAILDEQFEVLESVATQTGFVRVAEDVEDAAKKRPTQEASFTALETKAKALVGDVAAVQPRVADKVVALLDKSRAVQQRMMKQLAERCDLVKKGTAMGEVTKKLASAASAISDARQELASAVETVFAPY